MGIAFPKPKWKVLDFSESVSIFCIDHMKIMALTIFNLG
jgi:hypothetical protein